MSTDTTDFFCKTSLVESDKYTKTVNSVLPMAMGLPKTIKSICPECLKVISATEYVEEGRVMVKKECENHGIFKDLVFSDAKLYLQMEKWHFGDGKGFLNTNKKNGLKCPADCGICNNHTTHTSVVNVDLTAWCNLIA